MFKTLGALALTALLAAAPVDAAEIKGEATFAWLAVGNTYSLGDGHPYFAGAFSGINVFKADARPAESATFETRPSAQYALFVVVIDDERGVRDATCALLTSWGCEVVTAGAIEELNDFAARDARTVRIPDLIIADLRLRDGADGIAAIQTLRSRFGRHIPGVIITGDTMPARLNQLHDSGLPVLHKPLRAETLRGFINGLNCLAAAKTPAPPQPGVVSASPD